MAARSKNMAAFKENTRLLKHYSTFVESMLAMCLASRASEIHLQYLLANTLLTQYVKYRFPSRTSKRLSPNIAVYDR